MTQKRLEDIATWAEKNGNWCAMQEIPDIAAYYADLSRCARAWEKLEQLKRCGKWRASLTTGDFTLSSGFMQGSDTAIEAVEAAGGGR